MTFRRIPGDCAPLPVVVVGAGLMGRAWLDVVRASEEVRLVGLADLDTAFAARVAAELGFEGVAVGPDAVELAVATGARAVIDVTVAAAHHR